MANNSAAWSRNTFPSPAQRYSIERLRPLTHPSSCRPFSNATTRDCASGSLGPRPISTPICRIRFDCARAASGHAAAPPSSVMNSRRSLDHLVGASEQHRWHVEAQRFRGIEVDYQLEFGRLLNWQVGGLGAL